MPSRLATYRKNLRRRRLWNSLIGLLLAALVSCSTPSKMPVVSPTPEAEKPIATPPKPVSQSLPSVSDDDWKAGLSRAGQSDHPILSRDGKKVLFISRDRSLHKQRQLYEISLETKDERRLTFQDGEVYEATLGEDDGSIYYSSTTDQIKERPLIFYPELKNSPWPPTDIYRIRTGQDLHERLTDSPGYEGFLYVHSEAIGSTLITASRQVGDDLQLIRSTNSKISFEIISAKPGTKLHSFTSLNKRKWKAWIEEEKNGASSIALSLKGQKPTVFKTGLLEARDIQLMESSSSSNLKDSVEILLTGKIQKGFLRQAYWLKLKDNCLQAFMPKEATIADLRLSADQKIVLWTMIQDHRSQVFVAPLAAPNTTCEPIVN